MVIIGPSHMSRSQTFFLIKNMMVCISTASVEWLSSQHVAGKACFMIDDLNTDMDIIENVTGKLECLKCHPTITFNPLH